MHPTAQTPNLRVSKPSPQPRATQNPRPTSPEKPASRARRIRDPGLTHRAASCSLKSTTAFPVTPRPSFHNLLSTVSTATPGVQLNPACPTCACKNTVRKGKRRNRLQTLQVYQCAECRHRFTGEAGKNKTYPLKLILEAVSTFNLGYPITDTQRILHRRFHRHIPERTISSWLTAHRPLTTYARLRAQAKKLYHPDSVIRSHTFHHRQVYRFQVHQAKLDLLSQPVRATATVDFDVSALKAYLASIETHFPHHFFQEAEHRSSKFPAKVFSGISSKASISSCSVYPRSFANI